LGFLVSKNTVLFALAMTRSNSAGLESGQWHCGRSCGCGCWCGTRTCFDGHAEGREARSRSALLLLLLPPRALVARAEYNDGTVALSSTSSGSRDMNRTAVNTIASVTAARVARDPPGLLLRRRKDNMLLWLCASSAVLCYAYYARNYAVWRASAPMQVCVYVCERGAASRLTATRRPHRRHPRHRQTYNPHSQRSSSFLINTPK